MGSRAVGRHRMAAALLLTGMALGLRGSTAAPDIDPLPELNAKVVAFAKEHIGKKVGDGECTTLALQALGAAGAKKRPKNPGDGNYVWGRTVESFREALPGDIVQFRDVTFQGKRFVTRRSWVTWKLEYGHHTAIVAEVRERGRVVVLLHQNVGAADDDPETKRVVSETTVRPGSLQKGGKLWIYRPVLPGEMESPPPTEPRLAIDPP